ncbi:pentapeptide repeat-containing protein [Paenibacillus athensensis]|uniref:Oxetanocin A resistance protein n=2 Tax=Paenibacillus athensensis TaxID=1967502 RepID=A0A4Y8Q869_9BACL|nr:pentapeptide repeat-containing protein [Paenibacillus athensensis]
MNDRLDNRQPPVRASERGARAVHLTADCERCFGLCCTALAFGISSDFAIDKAAGQPCPNLQADYRCGVHKQLRPLGFRGCTVYDCLGAGQQVAQRTFGGRDWRAAPETAQTMFEVFAVMCALYELLWYVQEALERPEAAPLGAELAQAQARIELLTEQAPEALLALDVAALRAETNVLLLAVSERVRAAARQGRQAPGRRKQPGRGADLVGANLRGADLAGAFLRGGLLIAADLRGADLCGADLIGADLRDAQLGGADLSGCLFVTQPQLNAALGDGATKLPRGLRRPEHWPA